MQNQLLGNPDNGGTWYDEIGLISETILTLLLIHQNLVILYQEPQRMS